MQRQRLEHERTCVVMLEREAEATTARERDAAEKAEREKNAREKRERERGVRQVERPFLIHIMTRVSPPSQPSWSCASNSSPMVLQRLGWPIDRDGPSHSVTCARCAHASNEAHFASQAVAACWDIRFHVFHSVPPRRLPSPFSVIAATSRCGVGPELPALSSLSAASPGSRWRRTRCKSFS